MGFTPVEEGVEFPEVQNLETFALFQPYSDRLKVHKIKDNFICYNNQSFFNGDILLRLDANRGYDLHQAIKLCNSIDLSKIEYFEEPLRETNYANFENYANSNSIVWQKPETDHWKNYLKNLIEQHFIETQSQIAKLIIKNFDE